MLEKQRRPDIDEPEQFADLTRFIDHDENDKNNPLFDKLARMPVR